MRKKRFASIAVIIDYGKVQSKVSLKYDSWHKDALGKFGNLLGNEMSLFHTQVSCKGRFCFIGRPALPIPGSILCAASCLRKSQCRTKQWRHSS